MVYEICTSIVRTSRSKVAGEFFRTPYGFDVRQSLSGFLFGGNAEEHAGRRVLLLLFRRSNGAYEYVNTKSGHYSFTKNMYEEKERQYYQDECSETVLTGRDRVHSGCSGGGAVHGRGTPPSSHASTQSNSQIVMRSIERRFDALENERPNHSTYLNFAMAILGQDFHPDLIRRWFNKLVDKDDYAQEEKRSILSQLYAHTKPLEAYHNLGQEGSQGGVKT